MYLIYIDFVIALIYRRKVFFISKTIVVEEFGAVVGFFSLSVILSLQKSRKRHPIMSNSVAMFTERNKDIRNFLRILFRTYEKYILLLFA